MSTSIPPSDKNTRSHESGAIAAWGLIGGFIIGAIIGLLTQYWLAVGLLGAGLGWVVGACIERARQ